DRLSVMSWQSSFLRPAAAVLLPLLLIGCIEYAVANPVHRSFSPPLRNPETYKAVNKVSQHVSVLFLHSKFQWQEDVVCALYLRTSHYFDHLKICCLHANILDFYLRNILPRHDNKHPHMHRVRTDLQRVSEDLKTQGCNVTHYHDHRHAVQFRKKLAEQGINKAVGEINILFSYLQDFCVQPKNQTAAQ
uniref:Interleukin 22 n=1 Tax=Periophthalmus magnuspinnatus TaxID=409849 RepID=A0A3B4AUA0_9GOBI